MSINRYETHAFLIMNHLRRNSAYFQVLKESKAKLKTLETFPPQAIHALFEIIVNIVRGNVKISANQRRTLMKHKTSLLRLCSNVGVKRERPRLLRNQTGGFIGALAPILAAVLPGILASAL